jgi:hypothetical protein
VLSRLSASDTALLAEVAEERAPDFVRALRQPLVRGFLSPEQLDLLRDAVGDELAQSGFDESYTPTDRGRRLEDLIDKLAQINPDF